MYWAIVCCMYLWLRVNRRVRGSLSFWLRWPTVFSFTPLQVYKYYLVFKSAPLTARLWQRANLGNVWVWCQKDFEFTPWGWIKTAKQTADSIDVCEFESEQSLLLGFFRQFPDEDLPAVFLCNADCGITFLSTNLQLNHLHSFMWKSLSRNVLECVIQ